MNMIRIATRGFSLTDGLVSYIHEQVGKRLGHIGHAAREIAITLSDVEGHGAGSDNRCRALLEIPGRRRLVAHSVHGDMYCAIDQSLMRAQRRMARVQQRRIAAPKRG